MSYHFCTEWLSLAEGLRLSLVHWLTTQGQVV